MNDIIDRALQDIGTEGIVNIMLDILDEKGFVSRDDIVSRLIQKYGARGVG